jgi:hypothetical protein
MSDDTIKKLEQRVADLESKIGKEKAPRASRKPSEYNTFMGEYIAKNKSGKKSHKELFSEAVKEWNATKKK